MNLDLMLMEWQRKALAWSQSLGQEDFYTLWLFGGAVLFVTWAWIAHRIIRKTLGHRQFRGTWYNEAQFEVLIKLIDEDNAKGNRVMQHDEMRLLRLWRLGRDGVGMDRSAGYF